MNNNIKTSKAVIVSCPRCHKQYRLDVSRLNYARLPDSSGLGVQLACSNCHEQWWELKKESVNANQPELRAAVPEQPFRNLTDISLLYQRQNANYSYQNDDYDRSPSSTTPNFGPGFTAKVEDQMFVTPMPSNKSIVDKQSNWKKRIKIALWSTVIFGGTLGLAFVTMKLSSSSNLIHDITTAGAPITPGEILIEDIQFDVKSFDSKQQRVIVAGNVKNPGPLAIPLRNIQIAVWGSCAEGQTPNAQGLCEIRVWTYKWKQDLLQPGEQLTFKGAAKIPANLQVDQVHVDVAAN
ncbi:MAG: hypothetical protein NT128_00275 [Proteobacteria bacterium]|nr:hypothetical protein [Pseudomonadota bacterium]